MTRHLLLTLLCFVSTLPAGNIAVKPTIVALANGQPITSRDLAAKLSQSFSAQLPQYAGDEEMKYQYFMTNWRAALEDIITSQLIREDAIEKKFPVSHGDIRKELEGSFGPNVLLTLEEKGLTYEQAWEMIKDRILTRRMVMYRVNTNTQITPGEVKRAYEQYVQTHAGKGCWEYQVISLRSEEIQKCLEGAAWLRAQLANSFLSLDDLKDHSSEFTELLQGVKVTVSQVMERTADNISDLHRDSISALDEGVWSDPLLQSGRRSEVVRLYIVHQASETSCPPFTEMENSLHDELFHKRYLSAQEHYLGYLREHFPVEYQTDESTFPFSYVPGGDVSSL